MKKYLNKLPEEIRGLIGVIAEISAEKHMPAYLVGGFARDLLLGVKNLDLDIVVEGSGIEFGQYLSSRLSGKLIRHLRFGTATVITKSRFKIDVATARKEFYPEPAHLPVVESSSLKDDHFRRDFTINAMALSLNKADFGCLIDFFEGEKDLREKKVRILHDVSFIDDPTRILRAIRFERRYNFKIETRTLKLLKEALKQGMLAKVEPQRLRDELILILKEDKPIKTIIRLNELAGLGFINRNLSFSRRTFSLLKKIEKEISWFRKTHPKRRQLDIWLIYLLGLLDELKLSDIKNICSRFVFRKGEEKRILAYKDINLKDVHALSLKSTQPSAVYAYLEPLSYEVIIALSAKYANRVLKKNISDFFKVYNGMRIHVCGEDLRALGVLPGPSYQKIFSKILAAKLNGLVKSKAQELELAKKLIKE